MVKFGIKKCAYLELYGAFYFWRTYAGQEIDWVEEREGRLLGYEFKWSEKKRGKQPKDWFKTYSNADFQTINRENYMEFIV